MCPHAYIWMGILHNADTSKTSILQLKFRDGYLWVLWIWLETISFIKCISYSDLLAIRVSFITHASPLLAAVPAAFQSRDAIRIWDRTRRNLAIELPRISLPLRGIWHTEWEFSMIGRQCNYTYLMETVGCRFEDWSELQLFGEFQHLGLPALY